MSTRIGRYEILGELGRGGMATVYHAHDPHFERTVAVKVLPREFLHDPHFRARFEREARVIAALEHRAIVPVHDFGEHDGQPYIVMRYMSGGSLAARLEQGSLPLDEAARVLAELAPALDLAHKAGIIHRDLKPGNILFDQHGDAHLSDFGIAKLVEATASLTAGGIVGTPAYMSPEQIHGDRAVDGRSDLYSLGVILFQILTGQTPYHADTPPKLMMMHVLDPVPSILVVRPDLPPGVENVIQRALAKDPDDRYQTAKELAQALERAAAGEAIAAPGAAPSPAPSVQRVAAPAIEATPATMPARSAEVDDPTVGITVEEIAPPYEPTMQEEARLRQPIVSRETRVQAATHPIAEPVRRRGVPRWVWAIGVIVVLAIMALAGGLLIRASDPREFARAGVGGNGEWAPFDQAFEGAPMVLVPAGCFGMGSEDGSEDERPVHEVCFDQPFWMDRTEVTQAQFREFSGVAAADSSFVGAQRPVERINWHEAAAFCEQRSARLPTEAEWEYAARGPDGLDYPWGDEFIRDFVVWGGNQTGESGRLEGASWVGALDMSGNVAEWTADWYGPYVGGRQTNPDGPGGGDFRVMRGGSWGAVTSDALRAASRQNAVLDHMSSGLGFRCARDY